MQPGTSLLLVTDCGYFPKAKSHGITREVPIPQAIVIVCTDGWGWCRVNGTTYDVGPRQVVVIPPGVPHAYGSNQDDPWTLWWVHLDGKDVPELLKSAGEHPVQTLNDIYRSTDLLEEIVRMMERDASQASLLSAAGAAWHFLASLSSGTTRGGSQSDAIEQAKIYLQKNVSERVGVAELASMAGLSSSHFSVLFRKNVGLPVVQYQTQLRMTRARDLLDTTKLSVSDIAAACGYTDPFYFSRQFRRVHGITALRYRAQRKG